VTLHKQSITGCTQAESGTNILTDEKAKAKAKANYALVNGALRLSSGERLKIQGRRRGTNPATSCSMSIKHDFGPCPQYKLGAIDMAEFSRDLDLNRFAKTHPSPTCLP
jgi:hypothetical protein